MCLKCVISSLLGFLLELEIRSITVSETAGNTKVEHQGQRSGAEKSESPEHATEKVKFCPMIGLL